MSQSLEQFQTEWNEIKTQLDDVQAQYQALYEKRSSFYVAVMFPEDYSPEAQAEFQQMCQTQVSQWSINLTELDREIKTTQLKIRKIQTKLSIKQSRIYELQAKEIWKKLIQQANTINQCSKQLEQEIQTFWEIAHSFQPNLEDWLPSPPQLAHVEEQIKIPHIGQTEHGLQLMNKEIDFDVD